MRMPAPGIPIAAAPPPQLSRKCDAPLVRPRRESTRTKYNVMSHCVRLGVHVPRRCRSRCVGMDAHFGKVVPEARFEIGPRRRVERLPRRAQHLMHDAGRLAGGGLRPGWLFLKFFLLLAKAFARPRVDACRAAKLNRKTIKCRYCDRASVQCCSTGSGKRAGGASAQDRPRGLPGAEGRNPSQYRAACHHRPGVDTHRQARLGVWSFKETDPCQHRSAQVRLRGRCAGGAGSLG
jgi:hypothetical protein